MTHRILFTLTLFTISMTFSQNEFSVSQLVGKSNDQFYGIRNGNKLQKEVNEAFELMCADAVKSGIDIKIVSSYRSYEHQKRIWNRKYNHYISDGLEPKDAILKIIEFSTIPGTSRHHWGTEIDIVDGGAPQPEGDILEAIHFEGDGVYVKLKNWMDAHASEYGFCLVYDDDSDRKGFEYEPWHYSYISISKEMLAEYLLIDIQEFLKQDKLLGSEYFTDEFISHYINENILDINPDLKE